MGIWRGWIKEQNVRVRVPGGSGACTSWGLLVRLVIGFGALVLDLGAGMVSSGAWRVLEKLGYRYRGLIASRAL